MSIAAIIAGLLIWRSLPPMLRESMTDRYYRILEIACMVVGCATILGGIIYGFLKQRPATPISYKT